ncbi:MAG: hypothetical protein ACKOGA_16695, partial [Planctomycetaceae bacterium]
MPSWFATKGRLFGGGRGEPQAFSLHCSCGETLEGTRTEGPQVAVCRRCEQLHFVLPASPYPEPQEKPARRLMSAGTETDAEADSYALKPNSDGGPGSDGRGGEAREGGSQPTDSRGQRVFQPPPVPPAIPPVVLPRVLPGGGMVVPRRVDQEPPPRPRVAGEPARPVVPRPVDGPGGGGPALPSQGARPDAVPPKVGSGDPHDPPRGRRGGPLEPDGRTGPRRGDSKKSLPRQDRSTGRQRESHGTQPLRGREEPERQVPPGAPVSSPGSIPPGTATPHPPRVLGPPIAIGPAERGHGGPVAGAPVAGPVFEGGGVAGGGGGDPREPGRGESADWRPVPRAQARRAKWRVRLALLASLGLAGLGGAW